MSWSEKYALSNIFFHLSNIQKLSLVLIVAEMNFLYPNTLISQFHDHFTKKYWFYAGICLKLEWKKNLSRKNCVLVDLSYHDELSFPSVQTPTFFLPFSSSFYLFLSLKKAGICFPSATNTVWNIFQYEGT